MKKRTIAIVLSLILVIGCAVGGTLAWLADKADTVTNTFTAGDVQITLDEAPVNEKGQETTGARVQANSYELIPGSSYNKDPTVHVQPGSEACYVFVTVENNLNEYVTFDNGQSLDDAIAAHGWTKLEGETNVWYKTVDEVAVDAAAVDLVVFENFEVAGTVTGAQLASNEAKTIVVNAYAVQSENIADPAAAWKNGGDASWNVVTSGT